MRLLKSKGLWVFYSFSISLFYRPVPLISNANHIMIEDFLYLSNNAKALSEKAYQEFLEIENIVEDEI
jgi:hypothetical protein